MIIVVTDNLRKFSELQRIFGRYGIALERLSRESFHEEQLHDLFARRPALLAVLDETSQITAPDDHGYLSDWRDERYHLLTAVNRGRLIAWTRNQDSPERKIYRHQIPGWLDHSRHDIRPDGEIFDWDAIFVVASTGLTYEQMRQRGLKNSVRDQVVSAFLIDHLYFEERVDLNWSPQHPGKAVDFDNDVASLLAAHPYIDSEAIAPYGLDALLSHVLAEGVFFRAAINRRQKNYWAPGLNGGIPLTPKRDPIHEVTFMMHDLMHQLLPDLVFTGVRPGDDEATLRNVYAVWRMISEAFTLVLADMLFVDALVHAGHDYDFGARRIWPLFEAMELDIADDLEPRLRALLYANTRYALLGDDEALRALRGNSVDEEVFDAALLAYQSKYEGYFRADWRWTISNFEAMRSRAEVFARWGELVGQELFEACRLRRLETVVDELAADPQADLGSLEGVVEALFERAFAHVAARLRPHQPPSHEDGRRAAACRRFMTGQILMCAAWDVLPQAQQLGQTLSRTLRGPLEATTIARLEDRFAHHLDRMVEQHLISEDDRRTWLGAHPLFEPAYVTYDAPDDMPLREVAQQSFAAPRRATRATVTIDDIAFVDLSRLWDSVRECAPHERLTRLLEAAGVRFHDEAQHFVAEPAVAICGIGGLPVHVGPQEELHLGDLARLSPRALRDAQASMMGFAAFMSYLNPRDLPADAMWRAVAGYGHVSVAHTASLNILIAGHSSAVEHELASQRDIVHLSRLTVARTRAQCEPPLVVHQPELLPMMQRLRRVAIEETEQARAQLGTTRHALEGINQAFPAAKASIVMVSASLRNLQKLVAQRHDEGKEDELRWLLGVLDRQLHHLFPLLFRED